MIKKLKRRVVTISMVLISVVVALFYFVACAAISLEIRYDVQNVLEDSADAGAFNFLPSIDSGDMDGYGIYYGNICVARFDSMSNTVRICEGSSADGVRFQINGESDIRFRGQVSLDQTFARSEDMEADEKDVSGGTEEVAEAENRTEAADARTDKTSDDSGSSAE